MNVIVWLRNDLRINDNPLLHKAFAVASHVTLVYIFDTHYFQQTPLGLPKTGQFRAKFLIESVENLKKQLQERNSDLSVYMGNSAELLPRLAQELEVSYVFTSKEITSEEISIEENVKTALQKIGVTLKFSWQSTLLQPEQLPFELAQLPDIFTAFRKKVEKYSNIDTPLPIPTTFSASKLAATKVPSLADLGLKDYEKDSRIVLDFEGGEQAALARLQHYFFETDHLKSYKETRNGLLGEAYSSKFSAWLANGSISAKYIWAQIKKYENERISNESTYWLGFELWWRDYFRFVALKYGNQIFQCSGIQQKSISFQQNRALFNQWANAKTGIPFIDANMTELNQTGFMSNRGRQNVASYLVKDLKIDWRWGASYFETQLIDYDVCSNWGNWIYIAGVGNDPRENRYFNIIKQANQYDPNGDFVRHWLA